MYAILAIDLAYSGCITTSGLAWERESAVTPVSVADIIEVLLFSVDQE
jgi:hypothetical protein